MFFGRKSRTDADGDGKKVKIGSMKKIYCQMWCMETRALRREVQNHLLSIQCMIIYFEYAVGVCHT